MQYAKQFVLSTAQCHRSNGAGFKSSQVVKCGIKFVRGGGWNVVGIFHHKQTIQRGRARHAVAVNWQTHWSAIGHQHFVGGIRIVCHRVSEAQHSIFLHQNASSIAMKNAKHFLEQAGEQSVNILNVSKFGRKPIQRIRALMHGFSQ